MLLTKINFANFFEKLRKIFDFLKKPKKENVSIAKFHYEGKQLNFTSTFLEVLCSLSHFFWGQKTNTLQN